MFKTFKSALLVAMSLGIGLSVTNAWANDSANIQDSVQINTIDGEKNTSIQTSTQKNQDIRHGYTRGNSGSSQTNAQDGLIRGYGNHNRQHNEQRSNTIRTR